MAIARPLFFEGQILAARDLQESVDYARGGRQRHNRISHSWGIATGLELEASARVAPNNEAYVEVSMAPGMAIDGNGRELLLTESLRLAPERFIAANVKVDNPDEPPWYPIFVRGLDRQSATAAGLLGGCTPGAGLATRAAEQVEVDFGRPGAAPDLPAEPPLGQEIAGSPWPVLVGFVQWDEALEKFTAASGSATGVRRRYVGVIAEDVESQSGRLQLRTQPTSETGATAVHIDREALRFGLQDGSGKLTELFAVNRRGEVTAAGRPLGGGVRMASGLLMHGLRVPLPAGVTEEAVASGDITLHIDVTPHLDFPRSASVVGAVPTRCLVDDDRRLHCMWWLIPSFDVEPGIARYTVTATVVGPESP